jgi:release factor glutamine methyltransferase
MSRTPNVGEFIAYATKRLHDAGVPTARLDCIVLLEDATETDRSWLLAHPEFVLSDVQLQKLDKQLVRRSEHIPLAYIRGHAEFYGRTFKVNPHTLVPRPETENIIELLKRLRLRVGTRLLDVGTGSGCIAITAALELPEFEVNASDIDRQALQVAEQNAASLDAHVTFYISNLLERAGPVDVITANLPYVPDNFKINTAAAHEPRHAIFGGDDGLDLYRDLFGQLGDRETLPKFVITESLPPQHEMLESIAKVFGYTIRITEDFVQLFELS